MLDSLVSHLVSMLTGFYWLTVPILVLACLFCGRPSACTRFVAQRQSSTEPMFDLEGKKNLCYEWMLAV